MRTALLLLLMVFAAGCGIFSRTKNTFYSLETTPFEQTVAAATPIAIDGIELPPGLDRREIVVRDEEGKLDVRGNELWAGPLEDMIIHTLAFNLARRLPEGMVVLPGQAKPAGTVRTFFIVFEEFTAGPENALTLDARITSGTSTTRERIEVPLQSLDSESVVVAMNSALGTLAERIAP